MKHHPALPPQVHFIERDWLSANHILLGHDDGRATLIDTGYGSTLATTFDRLAPYQQQYRIERVINTHIHSDHIGGNAELARRIPGLRILVPEAEVPALECWDAPEQMLTYADQQCERFTWQDTLAHGDSLHMAGMDWLVLSAPGHDMGAIVLYAPQARLLITADALWEHGFGFVPPQAIDPRPLAAQRATFDLLEDLEVDWVMPGHGPIFRDFRGALRRARAKLDALAQDDLRIARSVAKGMFAYAMLWRRRIPRADLIDYVRTVGIHRDYNQQFFRLSDEAYAQWLVQELTRAGKLALVGEDIVSLEAVSAAPRSSA